MIPAAANRRARAVRLRRTLGLVLAAAGLLALAACGGSSEEQPSVAQITEEQAPTADPTPADAGRDAEDIVIDFTQCLRDEGFDVPDPDFSASAAETQRQLNERGIDTDSPAFNAAVTTCEPRLAGILQAFSIEELQQLADATVEYARCMRELGIDLPDPDFTQGLTSIFPEDVDVSAPGFEEADRECETAFEDAPDIFAED